MSKIYNVSRRRQQSNPKETLLQKVHGIKQLLLLKEKKGWDKSMVNKEQAET